MSTSKTPGDSFTMERTAYAPNPSPQERAEAYEVVCASMPDEEALQLLLLLGFRLKAKTNARLREARLGLLVEMLDENAYVPKSSEYDREVERRASMGQEWPDHRELGRAYGTWLGAVVAAARHYFAVGGARGVPHTYAYARLPRPAFTPPMVIDAITRCRDALGPWPSIYDWPTEQDYFAWAKIQRRLAWSITDDDGIPVRDPLLPDRQAFFKQYPTYERAVSVAIAALVRGGETP